MEAQAKKKILKFWNSAIADEQNPPRKRPLSSLERNKNINQTTGVASICQILGHTSNSDQDDDNGGKFNQSDMVSILDQDDVEHTIKLLIEDVGGKSSNNLCMDEVLSNSEFFSTNKARSQF